MPTYEYECGACGSVTEIFQSITEPRKKKCPSCGKLRLKRLIGAGGGIIFKGTGFYETDYRSESYKARAKAEASGGKSDSEKSGSGSSGSSGASDGKSGSSKSGSESKGSSTGDSTSKSTAKDPT